MCTFEVSGGRFINLMLIGMIAALSKFLSGSTRSSKVNKITFILCDRIIRLITWGYIKNLMP